MWCKIWIQKRKNTVVSGDSLWGIAKKYKTSMNNIIQTNKLEDPNDIQIGQKILVIR